MTSENFKTIIEDKLAALRDLQKEAETGCETVSLDQTRVGRLSRMDAMQAQAMNQAAQRRRSEEIARLKAAQQRLEHNDYGVCMECDEPISEGRLKLDPAADYCIHCAEKNE